MRFDRMWLRILRLWGIGLTPLLVAGRCGCGGPCGSLQAHRPRALTRTSDTAPLRQRDCPVELSDLDVSREIVDEGAAPARAREDACAVGDRERTCGADRVPVGD